MPRLATISICLFLTLILALFLIWPKYQDLRSLRIKIKTKETERQYQEEYFSNLNKIYEELRQYETEISKIDSVLPREPSIPSLLNFLEKASTQNGLVFKELGSFSIIPPKEGRIKEIYLDFSVSGSYSFFKNFLNTLEKSAKIIEVENISFSFEEGEAFSYSLKIKTHSY